MYGDSIDFASSKADTYTVTNSDVLSELNAYFKSYIARSTGESVEEHRDIQEELDGIFNARTVDDAMDSIYRASPIESSRNSMSSSSSSSSSSDDEEISFDDPTKQGMLDVEILDQHIDKSSLNGGNDASRAIENMAGGFKGEMDSEDAPSAPIKDDFEGNMLGGNASSTNMSEDGLLRGHTEVTSEIRVKGKRVTEFDRNGSNYLKEDGYIAMNMLGGAFDGSEEENGEVDTEDDMHKSSNEQDWLDDDYPVHSPDNRAEQIDDPVQGPGEWEHSDYSDEYEVETDADDSPVNMSSEIDHVLNQLRNKTARTLTGGTVNIRKKVVLTDMYPYILRS